jgi:hypothetical protein
VIYRWNYEFLKTYLASWVSSTYVDGADMERKVYRGGEGVSLLSFYSRCKPPRLVVVGLKTLHHHLLRLYLFPQQLLDLPLKQ